MSGTPTITADEFRRRLGAGANRRPGARSTSPAPLREVAVNAEGRLIAWVPGRLRNPLNGSQGTTRGGRISRAKERRAWRDRTSLCLGDAMTRSGWRLGAGMPKVVVITAYAWNRFDEDGLASALKTVLDGCVDAGVIHRDDPASGHRFERRQVIDRKHRGVEIVIEPRAGREP